MILRLSYAIPGTDLRRCYQASQYVRDTAGSAPLCVAGTDCVPRTRCLVLMCVFVVLEHKLAEMEVEMPEVATACRTRQVTPPYPLRRTTSPLPPLRRTTMPLLRDHVPYHATHRLCYTRH
eukprot:2160795-Rhodomonas_salina.3